MIRGQSNILPGLGFSVIGTTRGRFAVLALLASMALGTAPVQGQDDLTIGRMRVLIWPEHDDGSVLVVYDGRFTEDRRFPTKTSFFIPKDAMITDACSLSPGGQHFCQLYEVVEGWEMDRVIVSLPFSNFYLSFHTEPLDRAIEQRRIDYRIHANHAIKSLEVDIEQPLRSTNFLISPPGGEASKEKGFNHFSYSLSNLAKGQDTTFRIDYRKKDPKPSVDIKYASMLGPRVWGSPYDTQRRVRTIIYGVFITGLAVSAAGFGWFFVSRRRWRLKNA